MFGKRFSEDALPFFLLASAVLVLYFPSLSLFFSQDDFYFLLKASVDANHKYHQVSMADPMFLRPLSTSLYFSSMYRIFGTSSHAYHWINIIIFALNCFLVYKLSEILFDSKEKAFVSGFIYSTSIVHFETVSWVSCIQDLLMIFFALLGLISHVSYLKGQKYFIICSVAAFILAFLCKETIIVYPVLILLMELTLIGMRRKKTITTFIFFLCLDFWLYNMMFKPLPEAGEYAGGGLVLILLKCSSTTYLLI